MWHIDKTLHVEHSEEPPTPHLSSSGGELAMALALYMAVGGQTGEAGLFPTPEP